MAVTELATKSLHNHFSSVFLKHRDSKGKISFQISLPPTLLTIEMYVNVCWERASLAEQRTMPWEEAFGLFAFILTGKQGKLPSCLHLHGSLEVSSY